MTDLDRIVARLPCHSAVEGDAVGRAIHDADQMLPPVDRSHDLSRSAAECYRRIIGMQRKTHATLFGNWNDRFQEIGDVAPHLIERMHTFFRQWRQVFNSIDIEPSQSGSTPAIDFVVAFYGAMRIEVVLNRWHPNLPGSTDRILKEFDLFIPAGATVDRIWKPADHHVTDQQAAGGTSIHDGAQ